MLLSPYISPSPPLFLCPFWYSSYIHTWLLEKHSFDYTELCRPSDASAFKYTVYVIVFPLRSKSLLISWLQSPSAVILEPTKIKSVTASTFPPSICHEVMGLKTMILVFFHSLLSSSSRGYLIPLRFLPLEWYHAYVDIFIYTDTFA